MAGDAQTGVSIMRLTEGLDSGPVCLRASEPIRPEDDYGTLAARLEAIGGDLLVRALDERPPFEEQDESARPTRRRSSPRTACSTRTRPPEENERRVRALTPHIGARHAPRRRLVPRRPARARVGGGRSASSCSRCSRAGGRAMPYEDYLRGHGRSRPRRAHDCARRRPGAPARAYAVRPRARSTAGRTPTARCTARPATSTRATARSPSAWPSAPSSAAARTTGSSTRLTEPGTLDPDVRAALHLGLEQLLFIDGIADHAAISESVELAKPSPGHRMVNAVLRRVQREGVELPPDETPQGAAIRHAHPQWLVELWWEWLGRERTLALLAADNEPAELALRVNALAAPDARAARRDRRAVARARRSSSTAPSTRSHTPATPPARSRRSRAPRSASRRSSGRSPASACSTCARLRAARRRTSQR